MNTQNSGKRDLLVKAALTMFNKNGLEQGGVRELAQQMGMSAGNVTYYFPTKEALVAGIAEAALPAFEQVLSVQPRPFNELGVHLDQIFDLQFKYRSLLSSPAYIGKLGPEAREGLYPLYSLMQNWLKKLINGFVEDGYFDKDGKKDAAQFRELLLLVMKFACVQCMPSKERGAREAFIKSARSLFSSVLFVYLNKKGKAGLQKNLL